VLHFGKLPPQEKPVKLTYGSSVNDVKIKMKAQHVNPTFYGYNSSKNEKLTTGIQKSVIPQILPKERMKFQKERLRRHL
jgi:hypothetical protein